MLNRLLRDPIRPRASAKSFAERTSFLQSLRECSYHATRGRHTLKKYARGARPQCRYANYKSLRQSSFPVFLHLLTGVRRRVDETFPNPTLDVSIQQYSNEHQDQLHRSTSKDPLDGCSRAPSPCRYLSRSPRPVQACA